VSARPWIVGLAVGAPLLVPPALLGADQLPLKAASLGSLHAVSVETARTQSLDWLKAAGKTDPAAQKQFDAIWAQAERPVLDRVAATLALGDAAAAKLLAEAADPAKPAPLAVPAVLKDSKRPVFFRANLALAYVRTLANRRVYEEGLEVLRLVKPEQVVDPAAYFFHRAVAEHALGLKKEANRSIVGLLEDVNNVPDRYRLLGLLMHQDMQSWRDKDLGDIARKMDNIERRLELARGGPKTQKIQKEVVARLDEIIKKLEQESNSQCNGGGCPNGGQPGSGQGPSPMRDSNVAKNSGPGNVDPKRLRGMAEQWGKLPEKERAQAMQDLIREMPARHREVIENYFKKLAQSQGNP
jgi:hypothetical protein